MKIISHAPCRISLFGGGTDVEPFASKYGGMVFNMAINIRQHIELSNETNQWEMPQLSVGDFYIPFFEHFKVHTMLGMTAKSDSIIESGLGSSASAAVALVGALARYKNKTMTRPEIAELAWEIEVKKLGLYGGRQDQYCSAVGGVNIMEFGKRVNVAQLSPTFVDFLLPYLVLFYTGKNRSSGKIQEGFKNLSQEQIDSLKEMKNICLSSLDVMANKDIEGVGVLLNRTWQLKKMSNKGVSNERIDDIYKTAIANGAIGGKIMGAGGGGHILFICEPEKQKNLIKRLGKMGCKHIDFSLDFNGLETRIV